MSGRSWNLGLDDAANGADHRPGMAQDEDYMAGYAYGSPNYDDYYDGPKYPDPPDGPDYPDAPKEAK